MDEDTSQLSNVAQAVQMYAIFTQKGDPLSARLSFSPFPSTLWTMLAGEANDEAKPFEVLDELIEGLHALRSSWEVWIAERDLRLAGLESAADVTEAIQGLRPHAIIFDEVEDFNG